MTAPILFVGDIHLGRVPRRLANGTGLPEAQLGPAEAFRRTVDAAIAEGVQAVVLAGDVVDQDQDRFAAWSHLYSGLKRLTEAGIRAIGVAGNHDHLALPRLAERLPAFRLLGAGGTWECVHLDGVDLLGWSFPSRHHRESPLAAPGLSAAQEHRRPGHIGLGVLHADLNAQRSPYAPVDGASLRALGLDGCFLGHIHSPGDLSGSQPVGYLGSLVGLDRSERGPRGPWLIRPAEGGGLDTRQLALGPAHWRSLDVDLTGIPRGADAVDRIVLCVEQTIRAAADADRWWRDGPFSAMGVTIRLMGRTEATGAAKQWASTDDIEQMRFFIHDRPCAVVSVRNHTRPAVDLRALSGERTPAGRVASLLQGLETDGSSAVPETISTALRAVDLQGWSTDEERHPPPDPTEALRTAAWGILDQLLEQRRAAEVS